MDEMHWKREQQKTELDGWRSYDDNLSLRIRLFELESYAPGLLSVFAPLR
jgi:hypothetical protein